MDEDDYEIIHPMKAEIEMIQSLVGCDWTTAWSAYRKNQKDVVAAVEALLVKPVVSGEAYLPPPPTVDRGLTAEQEERCRKGRWLQDQVNAVFSVAHSKCRTQPDQPALAEQASSPGEESPALPVAPPASPQGGPERMTLPTLQSETLQ